MSADGRVGRRLLLVEPQFLLRRTVAAVARDLGLADVHEASNFVRAGETLSRLMLDGMVIAWDGGGGARALLEAVRGGDTACAADLPVVVMAEQCDAELAATLKQLKVRRLLLKPFTVKGVLTSIETLWWAQASTSEPVESALPDRR